MARIALDLRVATAGGGTTYIRGLVPELLRQARGHSFLFVRSPGDGLDLPGGIETLLAPRHPVLQTAWVQLRLPGLLRRKNTDLYHSLKHLGPLWPGTRTVFSLRASGPFDRSYPLPWRELLYWNVLGRLSLRGQDGVIAVSRFVAEGLPAEIAPPPHRLRVIPHGLAPRFRTQAANMAPGEGDDHILAVGNVVPVKGHVTLLRAYAALGWKWMDRYPLVIAGAAEGIEGARVRRLAEDLGIGNRVVLTGFLQPERLLALYRRAAVFVVSSLHESFSFALLEAMACGVASVVTDCGGPVEVGGDAVRVSGSPHDARSLGQSLAGLLADSRERQRLGVRAQRRASLFTWEACARDVLDFYAEILGCPTSEAHPASQFRNTEQAEMPTKTKTVH